MNSDFESSQSSSQDFQLKRRTLQRGKENNSINRNSTIYSSITQVIEKSSSYQTLQFDGHLYHGQVRVGKAYGVGSCLFKSGAFYYGEWKNNQIHGYGIYCFENGGYVRGEFHMGRADGQLELCYQNGSTIQGWFKEGKQHGPGLKSCRRGKEFVFYRYGVRVLGDEPYIALDFNQILKTHLPCVYIHADRVVYGLQCDLSGLGAIYYNNTRLDIGFFQNGSLNGKGRIIFKSGDIFDGNLKYGQFHGQGSYLNYHNRQLTYGVFEGNQLQSIESQKTYQLQIEPSVVEEKIIVKNVYLKTRTVNIERNTNQIRQSSDRQSTKVNKIQNLISHMLNPSKKQSKDFVKSEATQDAIIDQLLSRVSSPKGRQNLESIISQVTSPVKFR
ncbi:hypothetical protein pb186bvf_018802 [Paramecium bursaria]